MTPEDAPRFFAELGKLAVQHRFAMDRASARTYYEGLADVPIELLVAAINRLLKFAGEFMPNNGKIRDVIDEIQDEREEAARRQTALPMPQALGLAPGDEPAPRVHHFDCNVCEDMGTRPVCPGCQSPNECTRQRSRYCPEWKDGKVCLPVAPCACARTNPTILRRRQQDMQHLPRYGERTRRRAGGAPERNRYGREDD